MRTAGVSVAVVRAPTAGKMNETGNVLQLAGRVGLANRGVELVSTTVVGQVQAVLVNVGETVHPGTLLARIYSPDFLGMQREYLSALSMADLSRQKLQRDEALYQEGIIAASRLEDTRGNHLLMQARLQEQQQLLKLAGMSGALINGLTKAEQINPVITVSAKLNGVVLEQLATMGARVEPGAMLFKLGDTRSLWVELQASQTQLGQVKLGDPVSVVGCSKPGKLIAVGTQVNRDSQTALVRAEFNNPGTCLRPNQYVTVDITTSGASQAVVAIPAGALVHSHDKDFVFVQQPGGFKLREVAVQSRQADQVWLSNTLPADTRIAISGLAALRGALSGLGAEDK